MLLVGLSCLGWAGYQYIGTDVVSERAFEQEKDELRDQWRTEAAAPPSMSTASRTSASSSGSTSPSSTTSAHPSRSVIPGDAIALLRIPAFGADYEVPILAGTELSTLSRGVGHYSSTALPGDIGNFAVAGHRVTHGQPFARLLELVQGDHVIIETRDAVFTYVLDLAPAKMTVDDTQTCVLDPVPCRDIKATQPLLTLTTCQDLFNSPDRSIGYGHLLSTTKKQ